MGESVSTSARRASTLPVFARNLPQDIPAYVGAGVVLTGSARLAQEAQEKALEVSRLQETEQKRRELELKRAALEAQIALLRSQFAQEEDRFTRSIRREEEREIQLANDEVRMSKLRKIEPPENGRSMSAKSGA